MLTLRHPRQFAIGERLKRWRFDREDQQFEARYGLSLAQLVPHEQLVSSNQAALAHATAYQGVWCRNVRTLLLEALRCNPGLRHFVDLGSGKGKACFYAATQHAFERIVGVEFSEPLVDIANQNLALFEARHPGEAIAFLAADASTFELPHGATLVFMFNPFDGVILEHFLRHNRAHFAKHRSLVAYANDIHRSVLREQGFDAVYRDPVRCVSLFCAG